MTSEAHRMNRSISRRNALAGAAGVVFAAPQVEGAQKLQTRVLGRTGIHATIIGMGCGESWWRVSGNEAAARTTFDLAFEQGIRYFDTGQTYGKGISETWVGNALDGRRKEVVLATKISHRNGDDALRETERSLQRLKTDRLDILHIHNLRLADDLSALEKPDGVLKAVYRLRDQKVARFIGITSHTDPMTLKQALERHDFDCVQMALNAAMQGHYEGYTSKPGNSFESIALPVAKAKNMGMLAMKTTGRNLLVGTEPSKASAQDLIRYALSLPIAVAVVGLGVANHVRENAELARTFKPMSKEQMREVSGRVASQRAALHGFFHDHLDA